MKAIRTASSFFLALTLLASGSIASTASTPVVGQKCSKVNATALVKAVKLKCVASGKKLTWKVVSPTSSTRSPSNAVNPYETVWSGAVAELTKNLPAANKKISMEYLIEPTVLPENQQIIKEQADFVLKAYSGYFTKIDRLTIVEMATQAWGSENIPKLDPGNTALVADMKNYLPTANPDSSDCQSTAAGGGFSISYLDHPVLVLNLLNCPLKAQLPVAHEFTHAVQTWMIRKGTTGDSNPGCYGPAWLVEGQAQVGSIALSFWNKQSQSASAYKSIALAIADPSSKPDYMTAIETTDAASQQYDLGALASLYLVNKYGWTKSLNLWTESAKVSGGCHPDTKMDSFRTAFKSIYGFPLSSFYSEVTPYLQYMYNNVVRLFLSAPAPQPAGTERVDFSENCITPSTHAVLQQEVNGVWVDLAEKEGIVRAAANCPGLYEPWTYAKLVPGMVLRWHLFIPGSWSTYSTPYTVS